ncbi:hypothetical protein HZS_7105 [Henneguya salminicola]|nr:hypothetical protein HZS_7105 [Henneguya salminicola]
MKLDRFYALSVNRSEELEKLLNSPIKVMKAKVSLRCKIKISLGKRFEGQWLFNGIEKGSKNMIYITGVDIKTETYIKIIIFFGSDTTIYSNCWKPDAGLSNHSYVHRVVNLSKELDTEEEVHANYIDSR